MSRIRTATNIINRNVSEAGTSISIPICTTFITTRSYIPGVVCLAKSLHLYMKHMVKQSPVVLVVYTNEHVKVELEKNKAICKLIQIKLLPRAKTETTEITQTHNGVGALLHVDSPRRILFKSGKPFIYLDADLLCVGDPWEAFAETIIMLKRTDFCLAACPAFRLKKRKYNATNEKGFNAGVIICLGCSEEDNKQIDVEIEKAMKATLEDPENATTEERILSDVFKNRYLPLEPKFNLIKRVFKYNPILWKDIVMKRNALFVHYMGAKPWHKSIDEKKKCDWDYDGYDVLENFWKLVYNDTFSTPTELTTSFKKLANPYLASIENDEELKKLCSTGCNILKIDKQDEEVDETGVAVRTYE